MSPPQVYLCSPSWTLLPPHTQKFLKENRREKAHLFKEMVLCMENLLILIWLLHDLPLAKLLQSCPTLCDPIDSSPPGFLSLGFSRQEHWGGLTFPSPMHESEKWKESRSVVSDSSDPMDCSPPGSSVHGIFQARVLEWGAIAFATDWTNGC